MKAWIVFLDYGKTTHKVVVRARSQEEAYNQAIIDLGLDYTQVGNSTITEVK